MEPDHIHGSDIGQCEKETLLSLTDGDSESLDDNLRSALYTRSARVDWMRKDVVILMLNLVFLLSSLLMLLASANTICTKGSGRRPMELYCKLKRTQTII